MSIWRVSQQTTVQLLLGLAGLAPLTAQAQTLAFPGAEGAGRYANGGRGGDVYYVTNLNDSGAGSLRNGIGTAPAAGRTILFKVDGTINLNSNLVINKPNITIAGQSAPGDGVTIANYYTTVYNTNDVVLQFLRFRLGDSQAGSSASDALWVQGSTNVIVDHVSASWSVDEGLSTSGSDNVTVQWSTISEALKNAGHPSGNHSFGSLINGGDVTYHHNLYASNDSRNPRPQGNATVGTSLNLDFVNNVIQNPGGRYGYSGTGDTLHLNYVNNYGIDGPSTTATTLFEPDSSTTSIHFSGNYRDADKDGRLDGSAASGTALVNGSYTSSGSRFSDGGNLPAVTTDTATAAYVQVVSRAGASRVRDAVDRRIIKNVFDQTGAIIDHQSQVGGYPALASGIAPTDTNSDGVPDSYALAQGYTISQDIHNTVAGNGYTHLQNYLTSLTPYSYAPTGTSSVTIKAVADAEVRENGGSSGATSVGDGTSGFINARFNGNDRNEYIVLKFDLNAIVPGSVTDASLQLTAFRDITGTQDLKIFGVVNDATNWNWSEGSIQFNNTPGLAFDGNSTTKGLATNALYTLGTLSAGGLTEGQVANFSNANLAAFLNLAAYFEGKPQDGVVSILVQRTTQSGSQTRFASKEATSLDGGSSPAVAGTYAPRLVLTAQSAGGSFSVVPEPRGITVSAFALVGFLVQRRSKQAAAMES
ncbi:DNRLRE domain-containing protein [Lacipirellula sp.]|uniref:DNRLRE domain-containing protein n=1 Tax=Lacipirellula sp. TaxID=2691419 RepID=UPI003D12B606